MATLTSDSKLSRLKYKLSDEQKEWLADFYSAFTTHIAPRGTTRQPNAKAWVTLTLTPTFMSEYHSGLAGSEAKGKSAEVAESIYVYYSNQWKIDPERKRPEKEDETRVNAENLWAKSNTLLVKKAVAKYRKDQPGTPKVAAHRTTVCQLFKDLPANLQSHWKTLAQTEREVKALATNQELTGDDKKIFTNKYLLRVARLFKEGKLKAGIYSRADIAAEKPKELELADDDTGGTVLLINAVFSPGVQGFKDTNEHRDSANQFGEYLREYLDKMVVDKSPPAAVIPAKDGFPEVPASYKEQSLRDNQAMVRTSIRAHWQIASGQGAVPWKEICKSIENGEDVWVDPNRLPNGARFVDPCEMSLDECCAWLEHLSLRQDKTSDEASHFQFSQVYACTKHEFPEYTEILSREKVRRANNDVQLVRLKGYYRKPNTFDTIKYPDSTWKYVQYLRSLTRLAPTPVIDKNETSVYLGWFRGLETDDADVFNLVRAIITATNKLERFAPLSAENELWFDPDGKPLQLPLVIPQSPPVENDVEVFTRRFWAHRSLFGMIDGLEEKGTFGYFGKWQNSQRDGPLFDPVTKTFQGGKLGIAWNTRGLLKVTANVGAALGKIEPPKEAPADYNLGGPCLKDWNTLVQWIREWCDLLETAANNLLNIIPDQMRAKALASLPKTVPPNPRKRAAPKAKKGSCSSDEENDKESDVGSRGSSPPAKQPKRMRHPKQISPTNLLLVPNRLEVDFSTRISIFGPKPEAGPAKRFKGTLQELSSAISVFNTQCKKFVNHYNEVPPDATEVYCSTLLGQIRTRIHDEDSGVRPLFESILKQRGNWLKAEVLWKRVELLFHDGRQISKEGRILQHAIDSEAKGRVGPVANCIAGQLGELLACCWAVKCIVRRFSRFYSLSLCWANHLEDEWESTALTTTAPEMVPLVASIRDWQQDCRTLLEHSASQQREGWAEYELKRYDVPELIDCWYTFGAPIDGALSPLAIDLVKHILKANTFINIEKNEEPAGGQNDSGKSGTVLGSNLPTASNGLSACQPSPGTVGAPGNATPSPAASANKHSCDSTHLASTLDREVTVAKDSQKDAESDEPCVTTVEDPSRLQAASPNQGFTEGNTPTEMNSDKSMSVPEKQSEDSSSRASISDDLGRGRGQGCGRGQGRGRGRGQGGSGSSKAGKVCNKDEEGLSPADHNSSRAGDVTESEPVRGRPQRTRVLPAKFRDA